MILLETLQVESFKSLRRLELRFPRTASVLVEGLNEAGKSSLFESIYFALYGAPLVTETARGGTDEVLRYGSDVCTVALTLDVDGTHLEVRRVARRGRPTQATLVVRRPGDEPETIRGARAVNARLVQELGRLDGDALLNSCFVEQKKLSKLEDLGAEKRKESLLRLLNLDKLAELEVEFRPTRADEDALARARDRLELAEVRRLVPRLEADRLEVERLLRASAIRRELAAVVEQRRLAAAALEARDRLAAQRAAVRAQLDAVDRLREAGDLARQIAIHREAIAAEERRVAQLRDAVAALHRKEREELPAAAARLAGLQALARDLVDWERRRERRAALEREQVILARLRDDRSRLRDERRDLEADVAEREARATEIRASLARLDAVESEELPRLEAERAELERLAVDAEALAQDEAELAEVGRSLAALRARRSDAARLEREVAELESELLRAEPGLALARRHSDRAREALRLCQVGDALDEWTRLRRSADALERQAEDQEHEDRATRELTEELAGRRAALEQRVERVQRRVLLGGLAALVGVALAVVGALPLALVLLALAASLALLAGREQAAATALRPALASAEAALAEREARLRVLALEREAAARLGGDSSALRRCEEMLWTLGEAPPTSVAAGEARRREIRRALGPSDRAAIAREASAAEAKLRDRERVRQERESASGVLRRQLADLDPAGLDRELARGEEALARRREELAEWAMAPSSRLAERGLSADVGAIREALAGRRHRIDDLAAQLRDRERLRHQLEEARGQVTSRRLRLEEVDAALGESTDAQLAEQATALAADLGALGGDVEGRQTALAVAAAALDLPLDSAAAREAAARIEAETDALGREIAGRPGLEGALADEERAVALRLARIGEIEAALAGLPLDGLAAPLASGRGERQEILDEVERRRLAHDEPGLLRELDRLGAALGQAAEREAAATRQAAETEERLWLGLSELGAPPEAELDLAALEACLPIVAAAATTDEPTLLGRHRELVASIGAQRHRQVELERRLQLEGIELDEEQCRAEERRLARDLEIKRRAVRIVAEARKRMVAKVLPNTERNMRLLLPLLTAGRYRDAHIAEDYRIEVWDEGAGRYVAKSIFSGGARDQFSLALRLAFALATLPQELGTTPGFIFLDEPLSSFDGPRTQALVELVTRGQIAASFRQIFVISHSRSFDPAAFPYRLRLDSGQIVESNLPS